MKIQYASDLHLEFNENLNYLFSHKLIAKADILILAGDIFPFNKNPENEKYFDFLSTSFKDIYLVPGNHEYYHSDIIRYHKYQEKFIRNNIHIVRNQTISIEGINFIFSTLWSRISPENELFIKSHVSDFSLISFDGEAFRPKHFNQLFTESKDFIDNEIRSRQNGKNIVITHHVPTFQNYPEEYKSSPLNQAFCSEMKDLIEKYQPEAWIYGHSHFNTPEFKIEKTRLLTNQLGYVEMNEHKHFKVDAVIEI